MAKNIKRTILSEKMPNNKHIIWAEPQGEKINLNIFNNGKWMPVSGGSSSSIDMSKGIMINAETDFDALNKTITTSTCNKLNIDINDKTAFYNMSQEEREQFKNTYAEEALALGLTTENHGKVVDTSYDQDSGFINMLCEDGWIVQPYNNGIKILFRERHPSTRYWYNYIGDKGDVYDILTSKIVPKNNVHNLTDVIVASRGPNLEVYHLKGFNPTYTSKTDPDPSPESSSIFFSQWEGAYDTSNNKVNTITLTTMSHHSDVVS